MAYAPDTRPPRPFVRRVVAGLLAVSVAPAPLATHAADLNTEMQAMFDDLGALGNVTAPGRVYAARR